MNIHANIIPSHKTTHADNKRVTSNLVVNDIEQISFISPVDDSNRKVADSPVNESQKINMLITIRIKISLLARTKEEQKKPIS